MNKTVPFSSLVFDVRARQYRGADGRFLPRGEVRRRIDADIEATGERMATLARGAQSGLITVDAWREAHALEIKNLHLAHLAAAKGGFHALTPSDYLQAARAIKEQYAYLNNRAQIAASDPDYLASERFVRDASSYAQAGRATFEAVKLDSERELLPYEVNVLDDGVEHHCQPKNGVESCQQQSDKGAVPTGTLLLPTRRACRFQCKCTVERFKTLFEAQTFLRGVA